MEKETIGLISGAIVAISAIPYFIRLYQRKIFPNLTSWSLWTLIGLAILLSYKSAGADSSIWPAVFGFTNPFIITIILLKRRGEWKKPEPYEKLCLIFGIISLVILFFTRKVEYFAQFALYTAIVADLCAAIPTIIQYWTNPVSDRPFAWSLFAIGYGIGIFAVKDHSWANDLLPIYMFFGAFLVATPLILHRIGKPIREWI